MLAWSERQCKFGYKQRKRTGAINSYLEEVYLRDDITCGCEGCLVCSPQHIKISAAATHILIIDNTLLTECLEVLELPHITNYVIPSSAVKKALLQSSTKHRNIIKSLYKDARRHCHLFDDVHCRATANIKALGHPDALAVALYYSHHLGAARKVVLASDSIATHLAALELDICSLALDDSHDTRSLEVLPVSEYLQRYYGTNVAVMDLYTSLLQARDAKARAQEGQASTGGNIYPAYLSSRQLDEGMASGKLLQGVVHVMPRDRNQAVVQVSGGAGMVRRVLLPSRTALNRALHGDMVVVRLLPPGGDGGAGAGATVKARQRGAESVAGQGAEEGAAEEEKDGGEAGAGEGEERGELDAEVELLHADVEEADPEPDEAVGDDDAELEASGKLPIPKGQVVGVLSRAGTDLVACMAPEDEESAAGASGTRKELVKCLPMDHRYPAVYIRTRSAGRLVGQRFVVRVDGWPASSRHPDGHVVRVVGAMQDLVAETDAVLVQSGVVWQPFCQGALDELPPVEDPALWRPPAEALEGRKDLTGPEYYVCSIDPPGCTDVDDALHVRHLGGGRVEVGVHIADVSWFVRPGSMLDQEAASRCTTVYLVDRRLDMLPALLSEQLCSLRERQARLAVSVIWRLGPGWEVEDVWFGRTLLRSRRQLTYYQAQDVLEGGMGGLERGEAEVLRGALVVLDTLAEDRRRRRVEEGALELSSAELRFRVGEGGKPEEVEAKAKVPMMDVVAEMMIAANAAVAERIVASFPAAALLRNHPPPRPEGLEEVAQLYADTGTTLDATSNRTLAASLAAACARAGDPAAATLLKSLTTRAMSEAQYFCTGTAAPGGTGTYHYGLALQYYTHFTSPIRRYADIVSHRQLLAALATTPSASSSSSSSAPSGLQQLPSSSASIVAGGLPQPQEVEAAAAVMNKRHRSAKRAQKLCSELYLLLLLHSQPHVEAAVVFAISDTGVAVFIPQYHIKAVVHLVDKAGRVIPPLRDDSELALDPNDPFTTASRQHLSLEKTGDGRLAIIGEDGRRLLLLALWQRVWVRLSADGSRAHGPRLRLRLLNPSHPSIQSATPHNPTHQPASRLKQATRPPYPSPITPTMRLPQAVPTPLPHPSPTLSRPRHSPSALHHPSHTPLPSTSPPSPSPLDEPSISSVKEDIPDPLASLVSKLTLLPSSPPAPTISLYPHLLSKPPQTPASSPTHPPVPNRPPHQPPTNSLPPWSQTASTTASTTTCTHTPHQFPTPTSLTPPSSTAPKLTGLPWLNPTTKAGTSTPATPCNTRTTLTSTPATLPTTPKPLTYTTCLPSTPAPSSTPLPWLSHIMPPPQPAKPQSVNPPQSFAVSAVTSPSITAPSATTTTAPSAAPPQAFTNGAPDAAVVGCSVRGGSGGPASPADARAQEVEEVVQKLEAQAARLIALISRSAPNSSTRAKREAKLQHLQQLAAKLQLGAPIAASV